MVTELTGGNSYSHSYIGNCESNHFNSNSGPTVALQSVRPSPYPALALFNYLLSSIRLRTVATFFDIFIQPPNNYNKNGLRGSKAIRNSLLLHHHSLWSDRLGLWLFPPRFYIRFLFMGSRSGDQYSIMRPRLANLQQTPCQVAGKHPR